MGLRSVLPQAFDDAEAARQGNVDVLWRQLTDAADAADYFRAWLALQSEAIQGVNAALLLLEDEAKTFIPAAVWPVADADVSYLGSVAQRCLGERAGRVEPPEDGSHRLFVGYPIEHGGQLLGAVVLDIAARSDADLQIVWRALHWGTGRIEVVLLHHEQEAQEKKLGRSALALDLAVSVGEQDKLDAAAMQLANQLAARLDCERVAVGIESGGRLRLRALSNAAWFERKAEYVLALENAMEEAIDQGRSVAYPHLPETKGVISVAHRDLTKHGAAYTAVLTVRGQSIGAITCLLDEPRNSDFLAALEAAAALLAPYLAARRELSRWFAGRLADKGKKLWEGIKDPRRPSFRVAAGLIAFTLLFLAIADGDYRVSGQAVVEGELQRAIVAPFDGFIASSSIRAGQRVRAGDTLAALDDRDLSLEYQKWLAQSEQAERKYRDALAKHERANAQILSAQLAEASAQLALVEDKLIRAKVAAPFDGIVVTGDLSRMLGSPIEKGKVLFEVAPMDTYRVILKVPEEGIRDVRPGQKGQIVLAGMSSQVMNFTVKNVGTAVAEEGQNLFRVEAALAEKKSSLRPGMEGVGKIQVGERKLIWIWTHSFFDWLGLQFWHWLP